MAIQNISTTVPTDFVAQQRGIDRRKRLAEALQQQSMQSPQGQTVSGIYVAPSWTQGLAQLMKAYGSRKLSEKAEGEERDLAGARSRAMSEALRGMFEPRQQTTQTPFDMASVGQDMPGEAPIPGLSTTQTQTVQPTMQDYAAGLGQLAAIGPDAVNIGGTLMGMQQQSANRAEDRAFREQQAEAQRQFQMQQLREQIAAREAAGQRADDLRRELVTMQQQGREDAIRLAASMRPAPQPQPAQIIQTDTGIYERTRDGQLKPLTDPGTGRPLLPKAPGNAKGKTDVQSTMDLYTAASEGLIGGLAGTSTGPIAGRLPAITTGQQVAEGGVAAMAPVLKQIFRVAGEGTFTDKDQELLLNMVPKRTDTPEAAQEKIKNIDNIVSAKLGLPPPERAWDTATRGTIGTDRRQTPRPGSNRIVVDY